MSNSNKRQRTESLRVRLSSSEAEEIRKKALDRGVTVSEFMRCAALGRRTRSSTLESQIINELRRLGGLQKHLFTEGGGQHSKEYAEILQAIKSAISKIGAVEE